ncbi:MAG TPA: ExeM/NucH family extracellular endonuclease [Candidatus Limnocylindria bacterium]|nr:ExeM/NucH family extracellular endonuclease [Candidatus Limnocylindria bacterium]
MGRRLISSVVAFAMVFVGLGASPHSALAAGGTALASIGTAYTENFNTLAQAGTSSVTPAGWTFTETGTNANTLYTAGTGSGNAGDTYSFGASGSPERAFGGLQSGSLNPTVGAVFTNATGRTITKLDISYTGEQWRLGTSGRQDRLDFQFSVDATSLSTGTWIDADDLDFLGPITTGTVGLLDGNAAANRRSIAGSIVLNVASGANFWVRWRSSDATGADDGLAVDDFALTPWESDVAPFISTTSPLAGATGVALDANVTVTFSEPVTTTDGWYAISCSSSGAHSGTVTTTDQTTFVIDPGTGFTSLEVCDVTVFAARVTDGDTNDPPDAMLGDVTWSFTITDACGGPATKIHQVQGSGTTTPMFGATVAIEGVVVGDYQATGQFNGYYVQEEDADTDADPATSEGLFVFSPASFRDVSVGDVVRVRGRAGEFSSLTQLSSVTDVLICASGAAVSAASVSLPVASISDLEAFEGMLVTFDQTLTVTEVFNLGRFGEVSLSGVGRLYTPTAVAEPGADALAVAAANARSRIILDDGVSQQNIDPTRYPQGGLSASNTLRVGDSLPGLSGVMDYRFSSYRIQPVGTIEFAHTNPRTAAPAPVGGNVKIASFNVLNFFNGDGLGGGFPTSRGADTAAELARQLAKEVSALRAIDADIVGLMEIENDAGPNSALADLVRALNDAMGAGTYAYIDTGVIGTDEIKVALIYKPASFMPVNPYQTLDSADDPRFIDTLNRPSLAQTFEHLLTGQRLTVVVNHLKSKGSSCAGVGDPDLLDGQGNCNGTRTAAAEALADWIASDPTGSGDPDTLIIGDLNAYTFEGPITTLTGAGFENLVRRYGGLDAYSYVFNGESGYLDHALATSSLAAQVTGVIDWHINPDEPRVLDYNVEFKSANQITTFYDDGPYRSSDHDPVIVGLQLDVTSGASGKLEGTPTWAGDLKTKLNVIARDGEIQGRITVEGDGRSDTSTRIDAIVVRGTDATVFGAFGDVTFRIDVHDGGSQRDDTFRIRTSDGYDSGVRSQLRGNATVWPRG